MTSRERVALAVAHEAPDHAPFDDGIWALDQSDTLIIANGFHTDSGFFRNNTDGKCFG